MGDVVEDKRFKGNRDFIPALDTNGGAEVRPADGERIGKEDYNGGEAAKPRVFATQETGHPRLSESSSNNTLISNRNDKHAEYADFYMCAITDIAMCILYVIPKHRNRNMYFRLPHTRDYARGFLFLSESPLMKKFVEGWNQTIFSC